MASTILFKCPNCGGNLILDPDTGGYVCEYCASPFTQEAMEAFEAAQKEKEKDPNAEQTAKEDTWSEEGRGGIVYSCPSCGAQIVTDETTAATFCYYCHNPVVLSGRLEGEYTPDYVVPFQVTKNEAVETFTKWVAQKKFVPRAFYSQDQIDKMTGVYFPFMLYDCEVDTHIDTMAKRTDKRRIGDREEITTSTFHIQRDGSMPVRHVARNALKKANRKLVEGVLPFNMDELKPFRMSYLSGFQAEKRDQGREDFEQEVETEVHDFAIAQLKAGLAAYQDYSLGDDAAVIRDGKWSYALMPVWTVTYRDKAQKLYYFSVNGQSGKVIGELPVDEGALMRRSAIIFAAVLAVLLLIFYFFV